MSAGLVRVRPGDHGLPDCYRSVELFRCDEPLATDVELARRHAELEAQLGTRPTTVFTHLTDRPGHRVLGHPYPRPVLLAALGMTEENRLGAMYDRLSATGEPYPVVRAEPVTEPVDLGSLPVVRHRPGDAGRYVTAGVTVTRAPDGGPVNLGIYRIQLVTDRRARIFLDARTDGHRHLRSWLAAGEAMPIAVFLAADPLFVLAGAARTLRDGADDYATVAALAGRAVDVTGDPPVPGDAGYVIRGRVLPDLGVEGPFGEFKGYYAGPRRSNEFEITAVEARRPLVPYPTIVAGAGTGLALSRFQAEYTLYAALRRDGFAVRSVSYPLDFRGEFLALVEAAEPSRELLAAAMRYDRRAKLIICGTDLSRPWQAVSTHGFDALTEPYLRKGTVEGDRVGLLLRIPPEGRPVEY
jgi:4-hydroxy-3-polyprenylbenzoate decarboxylase